jgi:hypothetical protein
MRNGTAKLLTLFHPTDGQVRVKGVTSCPNAVLHPWLKQELADILAGLPQPAPLLSPAENRASWEMWFAGLSKQPDLPTDLPPLRMVVVIDNLKGHKLIVLRINRRSWSNGYFNTGSSPFTPPWAAHG